MKKAMDFQVKLLAITVWVSALLFGLYILGYYALALLTNELGRWNLTLPGLYRPERLGATYGMGLHFLGGGVILVLGCLQFIKPIRVGWPGAHRAIGRFYLVACLLASLGGLVFIFINRTIGGWPMDIAFSLYGILMFICSLETFRHAFRRRIDQHQKWAIRLYSLAIGSWFYRMGYGFWFLFFGKVGHTAHFSGPFDYFMDFFFFIPNLMLAEMLIRGYRLRQKWQQIVAMVIISGAIFYICVATYYFMTRSWLRGILLLKDFLQI